MAGSYRHTVSDDGRLLHPEELAEMLGSPGDVFEAVEQMFGMIWQLASQVDAANPAAAVDTAEQNWKSGISASPGVMDEPQFEDE